MRRVIHSLSIAAVVFALLTILFGAATTSTDSGMAFPDWPTSDGKWLFGYPWSELAISSQAFFEHHHRELAAVTGMVCVVLWFFIFFCVENRRIKFLVNCVMLGIIFQGGLGGLTVHYKLEARAFSVLHAVLGQGLVAFLGMLVALTSKSWNDSVSSKRYTGKIFYYLPWILLIQLFLGAIYRHKGDVSYLFIHASFALVVSFACFYTVISVFSQCKDNPMMRRLGGIIGVLLILQLGLGVMVFSQRMSRGTLQFEKVAIQGAQVKVTTPRDRSLTATAHVFIGAMMLVAASALRMRAIGNLEPKIGGEDDSTSAKIPA